MKIERLAHPPYSPDMSQRNFDFVGWTKTALQNRRFTDADAMVRALTDLFDNVTFDERLSVFQYWIERLNSVIIHNGEYFIKGLITVPLVPSTTRNRRGGGHYFVHPLYFQMLRLNITLLLVFIAGKTIMRSQKPRETCFRVCS
jgi:hypothetical protein